MPPKTKPLPLPAGPTKPRQFRFSDAEVATIDRIAREIAGDAPVTVSRTDVLRVGLALAKAKYLK